MGRWLRYLRTAMALCTIAAYALPAATHAAPRDHAQATPEAVAAPPCHGHAASDQPADQNAPGIADAAQAPVPAAPAKCPAHKDGATSCCVAMCHAALPLPIVVAPWLAPSSTASDSHIVDSLGPTLITRLDRPPKASVQPHG
jgi:hypothetical protein